MFGGFKTPWNSSPTPTKTGPDGRPVRPDFMSILGPGGGLKAPYTATASTVSTDMSPWLGLQTERIGREHEMMRDRLAGDSAVGLGTGMSNLAASGGLDSGARERLMTASNAQRMRGLSDLSQQASASRMGAGIAAEQMGREAERFNSGLLTNTSQFNAGNAIGGVGAQNLFNSNIYNQDMGAWGAAKTADAMAAAARKEDPGLLGMGGVLGTGLGGQKGILGTGIGGAQGVGGTGYFGYGRENLHKTSGLNPYSAAYSTVTTGRTPWG